MDILWHNETLFKNPEVFDYAYLPESLDYRSGQINALADSLKQALRGFKPTNCLILGDTATGKTSAIKLVIEEYKKVDNKLIPIYINAGMCRTTFNIFSEIHRALFNFTPPATGSPLLGLQEKIFKKLQETKKILLVILDDALYAEDINKVVYDLLRAGEIYQGVKTGIWAVFLPEEMPFDKKSFTVFSPYKIIFPKYTEKELVEILKKRAEIGLYPSVASPSIIKKIAEFTLGNDLRLGIELLKQATIEAENSSSKIIIEKHIEKAINNLQVLEKKQDKQESLILNLLTEPISSGNLFELIKEKSNISYSTFYRLIEKLKNQGLIEIKEINDRGKTRIISKV
jgi:cell division control protein 6